MRMRRRRRRRRTPEENPERIGDWGLVKQQMSIGGYPLFLIADR